MADLQHPSGVTSELADENLYSLTINEVAAPTLIQAMAAAKEAGIDLADALRLVDWEG